MGKFGKAERARKDFIKRTADRERKFAGLSVREAVAKHNKDVSTALKAAQKSGVSISLTDLMVSKEQIEAKKFREAGPPKPPRVVSVDELMGMSLSKIRRLKASGTLRGL